ncbi:periplasmic heavy metal sensor [Oceanicola sp. S124]|uniref:periplasmic heavy metal sensor n=1 Tax=Oceanicola sp. S124 TaxID=1042378 RepID=UPI0002559730|nr:periplasmic heavy metal sensor [Oceanicola sp. S124]
MSDEKAPDENLAAGRGGTPSGSEPPEPAPRARLGTGLRILLFASLALNLAVVGLVIGLLSRTPFKGPPRPDQVAGALTFALSEPDRRAIGREIFREMRAQGEGRPNRREEYARVLAALRAEPFQPEDLAQVFALQRDTAMRFQQAGQKALMSRILLMSQDERMAFADRLEEGLQRESGKPPRN